MINGTQECSRCNDEDFACNMLLIYSKHLLSIIEKNKVSYNVLKFLFWTHLNLLIDMNWFLWGPSPLGTVAIWFTSNDMKMFMLQKTNVWSSCEKVINFKIKWFYSSLDQIELIQPWLLDQFISVHNVLKWKVRSFTFPPFYSYQCIVTRIISSFSHYQPYAACI